MNTPLLSGVRREPMQVTLSDMLGVVTLSAISFGLINWRGESAGPIVFFPFSVTSAIFVARLCFRRAGDGMAAWGAFGGFVGWGLLGFVSGFLPPSFGTSYKWFETQGIQVATANLLVLGFCGCVPGLVLGMVSANLFRRPNNSPQSERRYLIYVYLMAVGVCLVLFGV